MSLSEKLLEWYDVNSRDLPWRGMKDPYAIWVSEIMLQQTRVETVIPYFERWMKRFPTLQYLADASEQDVLKAWEGLGYYSRGRNLHKAARRVVEQYEGKLPEERIELAKLPGIGEYTAGAIASMAFGKDEIALDGNIRRVLARLFDVELEARSPEGIQALETLARQNLPSGRAGDFNQAMMDIGATLCTPRAPRCLLCPLAEMCKSLQLGTQEERPVLKARPAIPHIIVTAAIIQCNGKVLVAQRPTDGLLGGMWEFPGGKLEPGETLDECLSREIDEELGVSILVGEPFGVYEHAYTHFRVTLHAFLCRLLEGEPRPIQARDLLWKEAPDLAQLPMGKIDRQIARALMQAGNEKADLLSTR
jgi:A/G-specific adenine glycosylase